MPDGSKILVSHETRDALLPKTMRAAASAEIEVVRRRSCIGMKLHFPIFVVAAVLLTGCIALPVPHVTKKSPRTLGQVLDAATGAPVGGAVVWLTTMDEENRKPYLGPRTTTSADGSFDLGSSYNFHLGLYANVSWTMHFPAGSYWEGRGLVTCAGYEPLPFYFSERWRTRDRDRDWVHVGDLRVTRAQPTATP